VRRRPSIFSPELGSEICLRIAKGESLRSICEDDGMPALSTVCAWLVDPQDEALKAFSERYARPLLARWPMGERPSPRDPGAW
jgi:hypothetical protein